MALDKIHFKNKEIDTQFIVQNRIAQKHQNNQSTCVLSKKAHSLGNIMIPTKKINRLIRQLKLNHNIVNKIVTL